MDEAQPQVDNNDQEAHLSNLCSSLMQNDPEITAVRTHDLPIGYGRRLGEALLMNTVVTELSLLVATFFHANDEMLDDGEFMLRYLRGSSASLKKVQVWRTGPWDHALNPEMTNAIHTALASNPHIEHVDTVSNVTNDAFAHLVRSSTSIRTLEVNFMDYFSGAPQAMVDLFPPQPHILSVPPAFEANQTLEKVSISADGNVDMTGVVRALAAHPNLAELKLGLYFFVSIAKDHFHGVAYLLNASRTIQSLALDFYEFDKEAMDIVVAALKSNQVLTKLTVKDCTIDAPATESLVDFMQNHANKDDNALKEFHLESRDDREIHQFPGQEGQVADILLRMLTGSSLELLSVGKDVSGFDAVEFFTRLAADVAGTMRPTGLAIEPLNGAGFDALATYLAKTASLEGLTIGGLEEQLISRRAAVSMIRRNGSILNLSCSGSLMADAAVTRQLGACLDRNDMLPELLRKPLLPHTRKRKSTAISNSAEMTETDKDTEGEAVVWTDSKRFPTLFLSAQQAPRTSPNGMLTGLLATTMPGSVGQHDHGV